MGGMSFFGLWRGRGGSELMIDEDEDDSGGKSGWGFGNEFVYDHDPGAIYSFCSIRGLLFGKCNVLASTPIAYDPLFSSGKGLGI